MNQQSEFPSSTTPHVELMGMADASIHKPESSVHYELLSGTEVADRMKQIFEMLDIKTACNLVHPTNVLTLAGLKGETYIYSIPADNHTSQQIIDVNNVLESQGIRFSLADEPNEFGLSGGRLENLSGYKNEIENSRKILPKIKTREFSLQEGFRGLENWKWDFHDGLEEARVNGALPEDLDTQIYSEGIMLGYPDQAIMDFDVAYRKGEIQTLIDSMITSAHPAAQRYRGAVPDFDYTYQSANDPEIATYIREAKRILKEFYESSWFQTLEKTSEFQNAYKDAEQSHLRMISSRRQER